MREWFWFKVGWHVRQWRWRLGCRFGRHRFRTVLAVQSHWAGFQVCTVCMKAGHDPAGLGRETWPGAPGVPEMSEIVRTLRPGCLGGRRSQPVTAAWVNAAFERFGLLRSKRPE